MPFHFEKLKIPDILHITSDVQRDDRGYFTEVYRKSAFSNFGLDITFRQFNRSKSSRNVLRGLHYQLSPHAQAKLVIVLAGEIFDVAVDIREKSPTFGQWTGLNLSAVNNDLIFIPQGFAHGFCVVSDNAEIMYYCDNEYESSAERGIIWNDPDLEITWPIKQPILSSKDNSYPPLKRAELVLI